MRVQKSSLGPLTPISEGGLAKVFQAGSYRLPGDTAELAYKEFTKDEALQAKSAAVAVAWRAGLSSAEQADLDSRAAWPLALVEEPGGTVKGLLMHLIPADFFCRMADKETGALVDKPLEMTWLAAGAQQRTAAQLALRPVDKLERLILLGKLIYAIGRLHKYGWVYGDLSLRNAVFALDPPRVMLIDCDGAASVSDTGRRQAGTPHWDPPECPFGSHRLQDHFTDVYKLGLAIVRCMAPGKGATTARSPDGLVGVIDQAGVNMVTRALSANPSQRPRARELYDYFQRVVAASVRPPEVTAARLCHPFRVRGQDVRIEWQIMNATTAVVIVGQQRLQVDLAQQPDGCTFRPDESGPVAVEVANRFGTLRAELGDLTLYELPPFKVDFDFLPTPQIPRLPALPLTAFDRVMAAAPPIALPEMPALPALDTIGIGQSLSHSPSLTVPLPQFGRAATRASAAVAAAVQEQTKHVGAFVRAEYLATQGQQGS